MTRVKVRVWVPVKAMILVEIEVDPMRATQGALYRAVKALGPTVPVRGQKAGGSFTAPVGTAHVSGVVDRRAMLRDPPSYYFDAYGAYSAPKVLRKRGRR